MAELPDAQRVGADHRLYLRPELITTRADGGRDAVPLAGSLLACRAFELILRAPDGTTVRAQRSVAEADAWAGALPEDAAIRYRSLRARLTDPHRPAAPPQLMGIVNVTPDSFSDGGRHHGHAEAIARGRELAERGATIVDVGGESTRPGALPVPVDEQLRRVLPIVERLAADGLAVSIDTRRAAVMRAATATGASMINDLSALTTDPDSLAVAAASGARVVLVHMRGEPATMQDDPRYDDVLLDVFDELEARIEACVAGGIARERLVVDPGIGLGKRSRHNLALLRGLALFLGLGCPILLGVSRKGWTGWLERDYRAVDRLPSSLAAPQWGVERGVMLLRVHDVAEHRQLLDAWLALGGADAPGAPDPAAC